MDTYKSVSSMKVPIGAVVDQGSIINVPIVGQQLGDSWVFVGPGAAVDVSKWPVDRTSPNPVKGKPPEVVKGAGKAALDRVMGAGLLVPMTQELRPDPAPSVTHHREKVFDAAGKTRIQPVAPDIPKAENPEPVKRRRKA